MNSPGFPYSLVLANSLGLAATFAATFAALANPNDYAFKLDESAIHQDDGVIITVSLTDQRNGAPVADAVIFAMRLDMAPEGMADMTTPVKAVATEVPGQYRFRADLTMAGDWRFQIAAKVQGEAETVTADLILGVAP